MALVVEDGTIVTGANSYVSDSDYTTYASDRGYTVGADTATREQELLKAMDYLQSYRDRFKGYKVSSDQALVWPRYDVWIDGFIVDSDTIPQELKNAQMEAAILSRSTSLVPSGCYQNIASESIDTMSISYHSGGSWQSVQHKNIDQFLDILLDNGGSKMRSVRV